MAMICAPAKLVHVRITNVTPGTDPASFNAQPLNIYRIGSGKVRMEEAIDTTNKIHELLISSEPDIWSSTCTITPVNISSIPGLHTLPELRF